MKDGCLFIMPLKMVTCRDIIVNRLVELGRASINQNENDEDGFTPLHHGRIVDVHSDGEAPSPLPCIELIN